MSDLWTCACGFAGNLDYDRTCRSCGRERETDQFSLFSTREMALDAFETNRGDWLSQARATALKIYAREKRPVSVDDVRRECPPPPDADPRIMGAIFRKWLPVKLVNSARSTCHKRPIRQFVPR